MEFAFLDNILNEIRDFVRMKHDILYEMLVVSLVVRCSQRACHFADTGWYVGHRGKVVLVEDNGRCSVVDWEVFRA